MSHEVLEDLRRRREIPDFYQQSESPCPACVDGKRHFHFGRSYAVVSCNFCAGTGLKTVADGGYMKDVNK